MLRNETEARSLIARYRKADLDAVLSEVRRFWDDTVGAVQVKTPDRSMDIMLNGWLTLSDSRLPRLGSLWLLPGRAAPTASATSCRTAWPWRRSGRR